MKDVKAKIITNKKIKGNYYKMVLEAPEIAKLAKPGQFVAARCSDSYEPLLRRPFSIHKVKSQKSKGKSIEILYEVVGKGTEILSKRKKGECVDVLGPLGAGFMLPGAPPSHELRAILIAGGIGVAPLVFLAEALEKRKTMVLIGARTKDMILCEKDFKDLGCELHIATDDGSRGYKGFVSGLFKKLLRATSYACPEQLREKLRANIYACGPEPMLKNVADICKRQKLDCQVSLETKMACGFGACLGCVVKCKAQSAKRKTKKFIFKLACKDGPVFDAREVIF